MSRTLTTSQNQSSSFFQSLFTSIKALKHQDPKSVYSRPNGFLKVAVPSKGTHFPLYGFSSAYSTTFPSELEQHLTVEEFTTFMESVNTIIRRHYPSCGTMVLSSFCGVITCCFTVACLPKLCFDQGMKELDLFLGETNIKWESKKLSVKYERQMCHSALIFTYSPQPTPTTPTTGKNSEENSPKYVLKKMKQPKTQF